MQVNIRTLTNKKYLNVYVKKHGKIICTQNKIKKKVQAWQIKSKIIYIFLWSSQVYNFAVFFSLNLTSKWHSWEIICETKWRDYSVSLQKKNRNCENNENENNK